MAIVTKGWTVIQTNTKPQVIESDTNPVVPTNGIAIVLNDAENYRQNEIQSALQQIRDTIIEQGIVGSVFATDQFYQCQLGQGKAAVEATSGVGGVGTYDSGVAAISVNGDFRVGHGNELFTALVEYATNYARDNYFKLV